MKACELLVIAPDENLYKLIESLRNYIVTDFTMKIGLYEQAVDVVRSLESVPRLIISRGETSLLLQRHFQNIPILDIPILAGDILEVLAEARTYGSRIAMIGFGPVYRTGQSVAPLIASNTEVYLRKISSPQEISEVISELEKDWIVVGHGWVAEEARARGMEGLAFHSRPETVLEVFREAEKMLFVMHGADRKQSVGEALIDIMGQKIFFLDEHGMPSSPLKPLSREAELILRSSRVRNAVLANESFVGLVRQGGKMVYCRTRPLSHDGKNKGAVVVIERQELFRNMEMKMGASGTLRYSFNDIVHRSSSMDRVIHMARRVSASDAPVLLTGDMGTGKEVLAQSIHQASFRKDGPFIKLNCASLSPEKLESTFLGEEGKGGLVEKARGGTLFLDKIASLSPASQMTLLRLLEDPAFYPFDVHNPFSSDIRLIASSDLDLGEMVQEKMFEKALLFRIGVLHISIPRLSERVEDISPIAQSFLNNFCFRYGVANLTLSRSCLEALHLYAFPGNIRELSNLMERLVVLFHDQDTDRTEVGEEDLIPLMDFPVERHGAGEESRDAGSLSDMELRHIEKALEWAGGNKGRAARMLGIAPSTLWRKCRKAGIGMEKKKGGS